MDNDAPELRRDRKLSVAAASLIVVAASVSLGIAFSQEPEPIPSQSAPKADGITYDEWLKQQGEALDGTGFISVQDVAMDGTTELKVGNSGAVQASYIVTADTITGKRLDSQTIEILPYPATTKVIAKLEAPLAEAVTFNLYDGETGVLLSEDTVTPNIPTVSTPVP